MDMEELGVEERDTASTTFNKGSSKITFSLALPPSCINPSPVVGMAVLAQLQLFQFRSTCIALSRLAQGVERTSCPERIKYCPALMTVLGGIVTAYFPLVTM